MGDRMASFNAALDVCGCALALVLALRRVFNPSISTGSLVALSVSVALLCIFDLVLRLGPSVSWALSASCVAGVVACIASIAVSLAIFVRQTKSEYKVPGLVIAYPSAALVAQLVFMRWAILGPVLASGLLVSSTVMLARHEDALAAQEAELAHVQLDAMLSQIRPHFLYNTLTAIRYLCRTDSVRARCAIESFSEYLKTEMGSLGQLSPIPFEKELEHTRNYLALEQLRLGARLSVVYRIEAEDCSLPALSVQTLAENAVRHGIAKRPEGGTLTISSKRDVVTREFVVCVEDDGVGFEAALSSPSSKLGASVSGSGSHIGISATRLRLGRMCAGTLSISSRKGAGTTAVIRIPKARSLPQGLGVYSHKEGE